jgi:cellulose synthase/poly-beta-1,6-N-acetylglucosamine synthase-like glycosyltransferase
MSTLSITFYVPAYNASRYLDEVLPGILAQTYPISRVLLIDDGSTDEIAGVASRYPIELVRQPRNMGLAAARNTAMDLSQTDLVAAVDADVVPEPNWLEAMVRNFANPEVAAVTGYLHERFQQTCADKWRALHMKQNYGENRMTNPGPFSGSNHVLRRSVWKELGGFDQRYRTHSEDCDLSRRLLNAGQHVVYEPTARADHLRRDTIRTLSRSKWGWDYWPKLRAEHYRNQSHILIQNLRTTRWRLAQHLVMRCPRLMCVDLAMLALHTYWDWQLIGKRSAPVEAPS